MWKVEGLLGYDLHGNENGSFVTSRAVPAATAAARLPTCCGAKFIFSSLHQVETGIFHFHRALGFSGVRVFFAAVPIVPGRFELLSLVIVRAQLLIEIEFFVRGVFVEQQSIRRVITGDSLLLRLPSTTRVDSRSARAAQQCFLIYQLICRRRCRVLCVLHHFT